MNRYRLDHIAEYAALRVLAALLNVLPYRAALAVAWAMGGLSHWVFRFGRREAIRRIRLVLGDAISQREARRIAWHSWRNTMFSAVELLREERMTKDWVVSVADCKDAMDTLTRYTASGKGAIIACPHMGNWELAAVACHLHGIPIFSVAAPQKNPLTDAYINRLRRAPGIATFARGSGLMKQVIKNLRSGGFLAILPDVRVRTEGVAIRFMGGTANLGTGMARFAQHCGVPIYPAFSMRRGWACHEMRLLTPIYPDPSAPPHEDIRRMTQEVMVVLEAAIRQNPGQWFWYNRRWVLDPIDQKPQPPDVTADRPSP